MFSSATVAKGLATAVSQKRWDLLCTAIQQGKLDINYQFAGGNTLLHLLSLDVSNLKFLRWLLEQPGININLLNQAQLSPLCNALSHGGVKVLKLLLEYRPNLGLSPDNMSPLAYCLLSSHPDQAAMLEELLQQDGLVTNLVTVQQRIDLNQQFDDGRTLLHFAVYYPARRKDLLLWLLEQADLKIDVVDRFGKTALFDAIRFANLEAVRHLIERKADCAYRNQYHLTPLYWACMYSSEAIISYLLQQIALKQTPFSSTTVLETVQLAVQDGCLERNPHFVQCSLATIMAQQNLPEVAAWLLSNNLVKPEATNVSSYSVASTEASQSLKILHAALSEQRYQDAKEYYDLELLLLAKWPESELPKFLQVLCALVEHAASQATEQTLVTITRYFSEAILHILPRVSELEQVAFYQKMAEIFLAQQVTDTAFYCYATALKLCAATANTELALETEKLEQQLQHLEIQLRCQYALPLVTANLDTLNAAGDNEALYALWQQSQALLAALRCSNLQLYQSCLASWQKPLELYASDYLIINSKEQLEARANRLLQQDVEVLLSYQEKPYNSIVLSWIKTIQRLDLTDESKYHWQQLRHRCFTVLPPNLNPKLATNSEPYRNELKKLRADFAAGMQLGQATLSLQATYTTGVKQIFQQLAQEVSLWLGTAPCAYSWLGIGSISRESLAPYSDLDCALLIADAQYKSHPYFNSLVLSIDVALKALAEPWIYLDGTAICRGLHLDGGDLQRLLFLPEAPEKQILLATPELLADFVLAAVVKSDLAQQTEQILAFSLLRPCLLFSSGDGTDKLLAQYQCHIHTALQQPKLALALWQGIIQDNLKPKPLAANTAIDIKSCYLKPLLHLCSMAAIYYSQQPQAQSLAESLETLYAHWHTNYMQALITSLDFLSRLRAEQHFTTQDDLITAMPEKWQQLELTSLSPWQGLVDLGYEFAPESNFHPSFSYAKLFEERLKSDTLTSTALQQGCKLLVQLPSADLYRLYLQLPSLASKAAVLEAMQLCKMSPYIVALYASLSDATGISLQASENLNNWQQALLDFTEEYRPGLRQDYIKDKRLLLEWVGYLNNQPVKITRLLPSNYCLAKQQFAYLKSDGSFNLRQLAEHKLLTENGRRKIIKLANNQGIFAYLKLLPEAPGVQLQADVLSRHLTGVDFHTSLIRATPLSNPNRFFPLLAAQALPETLQSYFSTAQQARHIEAKLDPFYFSLKMLETLVISPEDEKADNLGVIKLANGNYRLVSFDADRAFYPAMVERTVTEQITFQERKIQLKSAVFCFKQMQQAIHPDAIALFINFNPYTLLQHFLFELDGVQQIELFSHTQIKQFLSDKEIWLANAFELGAVAKIYERIYRMQIALQDLESPITHLALLRRIEPLLSDYYLKIHQTLDVSPLTRWDALQPYTEYQPVVDVASGCITYQTIGATRQRAKRSLTVLDANAAAERRLELLQGIYNTPKIALQLELEPLQFKDATVKQLLQDLGGQQAPAAIEQFAQAASIIQEQVLKQLDFAGLDINLSRQLLNKLKAGLRELQLQNCLALNYDMLKTILERSPELRILRLFACANWQDGFAITPTHLEYLELTDVKIISLARYGVFNWQVLNLPKLKSLSLKNCSDLQQLHLITPKLSRLLIKNCPGLADLELAKFMTESAVSTELELNSSLKRSLAEKLSIDTTSSQTPKPLLFSSPAKNYVIRNTQIINLINLKNAEQFLQLVVTGEQEQAEAMLQANPRLALIAANVTDLSGRSFKQITGFQYAVWALDSYMWGMIRNYLPIEAVRKQLTGLKTGSWVATHGETASWQNLIDALAECIKLYNESNYDAVERQWRREVGDAQRLLPVHVVNQYCHPRRSFDPCPDFAAESQLPRSMLTDNGEWFTCEYNGRKIGTGYFANCRGLRERGVYVWDYDSLYHLRRIPDIRQLYPCLNGYKLFTRALWHPGTGAADQRALVKYLAFQRQLFNQLFADINDSTARPAM